MITFILIATVTFLFTLGCGVVIWFAFHTRRLARSAEATTQTIKAEDLAFRLRYITLPIAILLLAVILAAYFYHQLPAQVAYHFTLGGSPDKWISREMTMVWALVPQLCLALLAVAIVWGTTKSDITRQTEGAGIKSKTILSFMGNIIGLPQFIIGFAMLDIFSYNSYGTHIMPVWIFTLTAIGLGGIILGIFFILAIRRVWRAAP